MSVTYDEQAPGRAGQPASPGVPGEPGGTNGRSGCRFRRRRRILGLAAVAIIGASAGTGVTYAVSGGSALLTTAQIIAKTDSGVVDVVAADGYRHATSAGTGIVLTSDGEVLTNNHVIDGATSIKVTDVANGRTYTATVVGYDAKDDLAVLRIRHASGLRTGRMLSRTTLSVVDLAASGRTGRGAARADRQTSGTDAWPGDY